MNDFHPINDDPYILVIAGLQQPDGSFAGDEWGEIDTRFSYCAIQSLQLILPLLLSKKNDDRNDMGLDGVVDVERAIAYILSCQNFDGGFGSIVGAESHAGQASVEYAGWVGWGI